MFIGPRYQEGIVRYFGQMAPFIDRVLRYDRDVDGAFIRDLIEDYDIEILSVTLNDTNPYAYTVPLAIIIMDKSNASIWSETDKDGNTIRDLPGYNPSFPYYWTDEELDVDVFNTYINDSYLAMLFANFEDRDSLIVYNSSLSCVEAQIVHNFLQTNGWWIMNRAEWNDCGRWKDTANWRDN